MKAESDWKKIKLIKAFESKGYSIVKSERKIFEEEEKINLPFVKYKISIENEYAYLIVVHFKTASYAVNNATRIANSFRVLKDTYVSSGVNGDFLSLVVTSIDGKEFNAKIFNVLKDI